MLSPADRQWRFLRGPRAARSVRLQRVPPGWTHSPDVHRHARASRSCALGLPGCLIMMSVSWTAKLYPRSIFS